MKETKLQQTIGVIKNLFRIIKQRLFFPLASSLKMTDVTTKKNWWKNNFFVDWVKSITKKREYMSEDEHRNIINKSEDDFEKNIVYLSAGGLTLSLLFIEKIIPIDGNVIIFWSLCLSWILLGLSLLVNLVSHLVSAKICKIGISDKNNGTMSPDIRIKRKKDRAIITDSINYFNVALLGAGIIFMVIFVGINLTNKIEMMKKKNCCDNTVRIIEGRGEPESPTIIKKDTNKVGLEKLNEQLHDSNLLKKSKHIDIIKKKMGIDKPTKKD